MFLLEELPDYKTMRRFASDYPEMEVSTTAACLRILKVASVMLRELERHFARHGLSQARFLALIVLEREPEKQQMPVEIARKMGISKKNTTRLLALMEQDGLITIKAHATDKRASIVMATRKGKKLLADVIPGYSLLFKRAMSNLDKQSKELLIQLLDKVQLEQAE